MTEIEQNLMPETRIEEVKNGMFSAANVKIDTGSSATLSIGSHPVMFGGFFHHGLIAVRGDEPKIIPAAPGPLRHGIGFPPCSTWQIDPGVCSRQRRFTGTGRLEVG